MIRVSRSPVFYGISRISAYHFTICSMPFCMKITVFFESPVFLLLNLVTPGMISKIIVHRSPDIMKRLYKSLVRSHLEFVWSVSGVRLTSPHYENDPEKLERVQHRSRECYQG